jgi:hypothetical protein
MLKGSVICTLRFIGKTACREFPATNMILQAFAAGSLSRAWLVTAVA